MAVQNAVATSFMHNHAVDCKMGVAAAFPSPSEPLKTNCNVSTFHRVNYSTMFSS